MSDLLYYYKDGLFEFRQLFENILPGGFVITRNQYQYDTLRIAYHATRCYSLKVRIFPQTESSKFVLWFHSYLILIFFVDIKLLLSVLDFTCACNNFLLRGLRVLW